MTDIMIDLETLGTVPGCVILSIGAVAFNAKTGELGKEFYCIVNTASCLEAGLFTDQGTIDWWAKQSPEARKVLAQAEEAGHNLDVALGKLTEFLDQFGLKQVKVWGNGADFDNPILACCYDAIGQKIPWTPWNGRCYRTLKSLVPGPKLRRIGTYHNALDDARSQAEHAIQLLRKLEW